MEQPTIITTESTGLWVSEPIAIVGSSCRLPGGATSPSKLWELLRDPRDVLADISAAERFDIGAFYHKDGDHHGTSNVTKSYLLDDDYRVFDHGFFGIHRREAETMDPQQKMLLEVVYEAVEAAGYSMHSLRGTETGVFVGQMTDDYRDVLFRDIDNAPQYSATGVSRAILANRVSYFFDWHGPSVNIDTACSSSLVALHQAVQALRNRDSTIAITAGSNLILGPEMFIMESKLHMLSPSGRCRMWDAEADGYGRGEGVAVVVLKTLQQALADNDHIECIIRETGVNQDGRSQGLTVPSAASQATLIRSTYARCGLDITRAEDRCQYFEAHGTGTTVGDPKEAKAIRDAFYSDNHDTGDATDAGLQSETDDKILYVGSVKTVIGHTEGAAGLVGVLKASLALQNAQIPPNMLFKQLSPAVAPFYYPRLQVPTELRPWPKSALGAPRRASVNSFGFGGTNAHVILESWDGSEHGPSSRTEHDDGHPMDLCSAAYGPFTLSANSKAALIRTVSQLSKTLKNSTQNLGLADVAEMLQSRRTEFPFRAALSAANKQDLIGNLDAFVTEAQGGGVDLHDADKSVLISPEYPLRILAVFTGQGAQWPRMGACLFEQSPLFRNSIQRLEDSLACLPDAPPWSLVEELLAAESESKVHEAEFAQPLTTALQIALVDLLRASGVRFSVVVGHSSGEIAAAYASGYLSAQDAIRVAFYRGLHSALAQSPETGQPGSMMAVGMSLDEATAFCQNSDILSRVAVAASNSPSSVTLSGDSDAILEAKTILDQRGTFTRILQVNKAYHSHHMKPCADAYLQSLAKCSIQPRRTSVDGDCAWYSSVHGPDGRSVHDPDALRDKYWVENMVKPVLFYQAVGRAAREEDHCLDLALEIGPHPALRGPVQDALKVVTGVKIPYLSLLARSADERVTFSDALGAIWMKFQPLPGTAPVIDWYALRKGLYGRDISHQPRVVKNLPPYSWDHEKPLFFESRKSKSWRTYGRPIHPLLGKATVHGGKNSQDRLTIVWRNILKLRELEWMQGHRFQQQVIFPAAGYVSMAVDAVGILANLLEPRVEQAQAYPIELTDLQFHRAVAFDDDMPGGVDITLIMRVLHRNSARNTVEAEVSCYSGDTDAHPEEAAIKGVGSTALNFSGHAVIFLPHEEAAPSSILPIRTAPELPLGSVDTARFYSWVSSTGLQYSGDFLVESIQRRRNTATVVVKRPDQSSSGVMRIYPPTLDATLHGVFAAYSFPGDGRMSGAYLPSRIDRVRIDLGAGSLCDCQHNSDQRNVGRLLADCYVRNDSNTAISGDVELFCAGCERPEIQIEGAVISRLSPPTSQDDRVLYARTVWGRDFQSCGFETQNYTAEQRRERAILNEICERTAYFFIKQLFNDFRRDEIQSMEWNFQYLMDWIIQDVVPTVETGRHARVRAEWAADTRQDIDIWREKYADHIEIKIIHAVGQSLPTVMGASSSPAGADQVSVLDSLMKDNLMSQLYHHAEGFWQANQLVGLAVGQLAHRYPHMRILEVGGGTGAATAATMPQLSGHFSSYTFTDISAAFFHDTKSIFFNSPGFDKMRFATLDMEQDPQEQGFEDHSFDLVIASNVLHATRSLARSLLHCRRLLRPGGFLVLDEVTSDTLWGPFIVSGLPGWWLGRDGDGRIYSPLVSEDRWDQILKVNGFSGVDHVVRDTPDSSSYLFSIMVSQATDANVDFLRAPLKAAGPESPSFTDDVSTDSAYKLDNLVIVGAPTGLAAQTALDMSLLLEPFTRDSILLNSWEPLEIEASRNPTDLTINSPIIKPRSAVICLADMEDEPTVVLPDLSPTRLRTLQKMFHDASHVFWVTRDCQQNPRASVSVAIGRTVMCESPHLRLLFLDIDDTSQGNFPDPALLTDTFLRMVFLDRPECGDILWSNETELAIRNGILFTPRIKPHDRLNSRLASGKRVVREDVSVETVASKLPVEVDVDQDGTFALREVTVDALSATIDGIRGESVTRFTSHCSSLFAFETCDGADAVHICVGHTKERPNQMFVALSQANSSYFDVSYKDLMLCEDTSMQHVDMLRHIIAVIMCESFLSNISGSLWLHEAPVEIAETARLMGESQNVGVFLSTSIASRAATSSGAVTFLHPRSTLRVLEGMLPSKIGRLCFMGMDNGDNAQALQDALLRANIVAKAQIRRWCQDVSSARTVPLDLRSSQFRNTIARECSSLYYRPFRHEMSSVSGAIDLGKLSATSWHNEVTSIIDWTRATDPVTAVPIHSIPVQLRPLCYGSRRLFKPETTYMLVGLAGGLGMSLVEWMAGMGARHFAIISRNPQIDAAVIRHLQRSGVNLQTWALDVADAQALRSAHSDILARMPPIAGVANGAMVLRDRLFVNMASEDFEAAMRPKALGTKNLDEIFYNDRSLDFFVLFASAACVAGNAGQANYSAANMFMASLAEQRRRRGLASSVIYLGTLLGVGHVARIMEEGGASNRTIESQLRRTLSLPLSEEELHTTFAEAVACGHPESGMDSDIIVGLGDGSGASWRSLPRFSYWISHLSSLDNDRIRAEVDNLSEELPLQYRGGGQESIRHQLQPALELSHTEAVSLLEAAFTARLGVILQISTTRIDKTIPLVGLGIDSLVAVELRSWVLKELSVDIPILKVLGGASLADLCQDILKRFSDSQASVKPELSLETNDDEAGMTYALSDPVSVYHSFAGEDDNSIIPPSLSASIGTSLSLSLEALPSPAAPYLTSDKPFDTSTEPQYVRVGDMSPAQARLCFLHQYLEDQSAYNVGYVGQYQGRVDYGRFKQALWDVCTAHESLRSCYFIDEASHRAVQAVMKSPLPGWEHRQVRDVSEVSGEIETQRRHLFDIQHGHVLKVTILSLSPVLHYAIFLLHHIALDGHSWFLFLNHLDHAYSGQMVLPPVQQSIEMSTKQRMQLADVRRELAFWGDMHRNAHDPLPLFAFSKVKNRQILKRYETQTAETELEADLARRIKKAAAGLGVTSFHFYLAALTVFLTRCLDVDDFSIGIVDANRPDPEDSSTMGYFLNMLPLRFKFPSTDKDTNEEKCFHNLVRKCRDMVLEALEYSRAPFDAILDQVHVSRSGSHHPLFQVALDFRQGYSVENRLGTGTIQWDEKRSITARNPYDIFINVTHASADRTFIHWTTQQYMYSSSDSRLMMTWYTRILDALAREPSTYIPACPIATETDLRHAIELGTGKPVEAASKWGAGTLIDQVDRIAQQQPESLAMIDEYRGRVTYSQMMQRINQISFRLKQSLFDQGVDLETNSFDTSVVGILIHPMNDYVCTLLAILRLGLTCIGLDLRNPEERLDVMLSDCKPRILTCNTMTKGQAHRHAGPISASVLDLDSALGTPLDNENDRKASILMENRSTLDQAAVILYTSGSTGVPKGVLLSHKNLHSHIMANTALFGIRNDDVILHQTSPGFDFSLDQIFHALANGGVLVIVGKEGRGDPTHIADLMFKQNVTFTVGCPSEYLALLNYGSSKLRRCTSWRIAFSGGEKLTFQLRKGFQKLHLDRLQFVNVYGPTEVTIACARGTVPYRSDQDLDAAGDYLYPMPNYSALVVDEKMNPLPVGFPGEVCISGDGVTLGYLNRPRETQLRFLDILNPSTKLYSASETGARASAAAKIRIYRSGDYGRLLEDGSINLLGRIEGNGQVKIRGMRVELDEVANVMIRESAGALTAAAVSYRLAPVDLLVAFVVFDAEFGYDSRSKLVQRLRTSLPLPSHMCPTIVVPVDELPTNVNGKLDRPAVDRLPIPTQRDSGHDTLNGGSLTATEHRMKEVWLEVLNAQQPREEDSLPVTTINSDSDFFQVGGNSMLAIKLRSVIRGTFGTLMALPELFQLRTLASMAARVAARPDEKDRQTQNKKPQSMDWSAEVAGLFDGLSSASNIAVSAPPLKLEEDKTTASSHSALQSSPHYKVLLTGATGFLGTHILRQLVTDTRVTEVHCVAIRPGRQVSVVSDKIVKHPGDLSEPLLGLSKDVFTEISHGVDLIIHNGAHVSFLEPYGEALRAPNALATRTLCAMALERRVPLHYVSTAAVAGVLPRAGKGSEIPALGPVSVADCLPGQAKHSAHLNGYALSKWVSEALLERVSSECGLPTFVHRTASLVGEGAPELDVIGAVVGYSRKIGAVPDFGMLSRQDGHEQATEGDAGHQRLRVLGAFDLVPVETVGKGLVNAALESVSSLISSTPASCSTQFIHHCNKEKVMPNKIEEYMGLCDGQSFGMMDARDWLDAAKGKGLAEVLYEYLAGVVRDGGELYFPVISAQ